MSKIKATDKFKNLIYNTGFLFRPITTVAVSFVFLVIAIGILVAIIMNVDEDIQAYEVLLAILTGVTSSLLIAIMMELYRNYRYNTKRQRELREYLRSVAGYEMRQSSILKVNMKYKSDNTLGKGRAFATFHQLSEIIPTLNEVLKNREYLYRTEIVEVDDILNNYNDIVKIINISFYNTFLSLINEGHAEKSEAKTERNVKYNREEDNIVDYESITDYPVLLDFLKKEAYYYAKNENNLDSSHQHTKQLEFVVEKAIFHNRYVFNNYFEVCDSRKEFDDQSLDEISTREKRRFEFLSNMISKACIDIDDSMVKLQKRLTREPYIWTMASYT